MDALSQILLGAGFAEMQRMAGVTITCGFRTATVIASGTIGSRELQMSGLLPMSDLTVDISAADLSTLQIVDRSVVVVNSTSYMVMVIERDQVDPIVKLHLKLNRTT